MPMFRRFGRRDAAEREQCPARGQTRCRGVRAVGRYSVRELERRVMDAGLAECERCPQAERIAFLTVDEAGCETQVRRSLTRL